MAVTDPNAPERPFPALDRVAQRLREAAVRLKPRGISGLWLFGSVARGEAAADSDIDLFADFDPDAYISLVTLASLRSELSELLGAPADLVDRESLAPGVRVVAEREGIRVF